MSDGDPLVVQRSPSGSRIDSWWLSWYLPCQSGGLFWFGEELVRFPLSRGGRFGNRFGNVVDLDAGATRTWSYDVSGRLDGNVADGAIRLRAIDRDAAGAITDTCDSTTLRWTARSTRGKAPTRRPGEIRRAGA